MKFMVQGVALTCESGWLVKLIVTATKMKSDGLMDLVPLRCDLEQVASTAQLISLYTCSRRNKISTELMLVVNKKAIINKGYYHYYY